MSCFDLPRIHFAGHFQCDVSTINNDVRHYDNEGFRPKYQEPGTDNGGWNPAGTAIFRFSQCRVTGVRDERGLITDPALDPVIGVLLENADARAPGKMVDLDPQQQMVSQIWGMQVRLQSADGQALLQGDYEPAAFTNLWQRQQSGQPMDQQLACCFTSILSGVQWPPSLPSRALAALRQASAAGFLSLHMNVWGYARDPVNQRYSLGRVNGTIAPWQPNEPQWFALGRQMSADTPSSPFVPKRKVYWFTCHQDVDRQCVSADLGNCLPVQTGDGPIQDVGKLLLAVSIEPLTGWLASIAPGKVVLLGEVSYLQQDWYAQTAGIVDLDYSADPALRSLIATRPLLLLTPGSGGGFDVVNQETLDGMYLRADAFVARMNPGAVATVDLYATQWGWPMPDARIDLSATEGFMGGSGAGDQPLDPPVPIPDIGKPADAFAYPPTVGTDRVGRARLPMKTAPQGPGNPRGYIDGQLYGIACALAADPPAQRRKAIDYISVLAFDRRPMAGPPTWHADIQPIFTQYGNLYPIMSRYVVDLSDYASVCAKVDILKLAFSLPLADPNHMPVTRDLSDDKRTMILYWLSHPGADGKPLLGTPVTAVSTVPAARVEPVPVPVTELDNAGKTTVIRAYMARQARKQEDTP